jgi:hypothetical protein
MHIQCHAPYDFKLFPLYFIYNLCYVVCYTMLQYIDVCICWCTISDVSMLYVFVNSYSHAGSFRNHSTTISPWSTTKSVQHHDIVYILIQFQLAVSVYMSQCCYHDSYCMLAHVRCSICNQRLGC